MKRILIFGDSIAAGSNLPVTEQGQTWPSMVEQLSEGAWACLNASQGGRPTDSLEDFVVALAKNPGVDLVVIALGTNDSRDLSPDCAARAACHLEGMIDHAHRAGVKRVLLVAPCNIRLDALKETYAIGPQREDQLRTLASAFEQLAERKGSGFVDAFGVISSEYLDRDGVHPDGRGNRQLADFLFPRLIQELSKNR